MDQTSGTEHERKKTEAPPSSGEGAEQAELGLERESMKAAEEAAPAAAKERVEPFALWPQWAREMAYQYKGGTISQFLIHGAVTDLVPWRRSGSRVEFVPIQDFLAKAIFGTRDAVIFYDQAAGITFNTPELMADFNRVVKAIDSAAGTKFAGALPRDPVRALFLIERYVRTGISGPGRPKSIAVVIDHATTVATAGDIGSLTSDEISTLVTLLKWGDDQAFLRADVTVCLLAENLSDLNSALVRSPYTAKVKVELPSFEERLEYVQALASELAFGEYSEISASMLAELTAGLNRVSLMHIIHQAVRNARKITNGYVQQMKKQLIEKECYGLLEFLEPRYNLDMVSGCEKAKEWLREDARLLAEGKLDVLPMGYLVCGPVGTGKSFLSQCYTGTIGIPCVKLRNFRSQWQGVTEGNWEKILEVLKATGPVGVIIDEADAAVGDRSSSGDSGTSARVFSMLATQMGDTRYRGKILWFLLTARPDLLPVDIKRQGRCEVHIPLFYPSTLAERISMFRTMARKVNATIEDGALVRAAETLPERVSGAEIEGLLVRARRRSLVKGHDNVQPEDVETEIAEYLPPQYGEEIDLQIYAAIVECTDKRFLPPEYRQVDRGEVSRRLMELKQRWD